MLKFALPLLASAALLLPTGNAYAKHHGAKMFKKMDTNGDGVVDRAEFLASAESRFERMDLNSDGQVTPEEARELKKMMREKKRKMRDKVGAELEQPDS